MLLFLVNIKLFPPHMRSFYAVSFIGTGVPLSMFCNNKIVCLWFVFFVNPLVCLLGAMNKCRKERLPLNTLGERCYSHYVNHLLHPDDWFSFWRLNCRLTSYQSMVTKSRGFDFENKWTFLLEGAKAGVPVTPFIDVPEIVCKHKNIEGGDPLCFV
jgi:hypothetical protein